MVQASSALPVKDVLRRLGLCSSEPQKLEETAAAVAKPRLGLNFFPSQMGLSLELEGIKEQFNWERKLERPRESFDPKKGKKKLFWGRTFFWLLIAKKNFSFTFYFKINFLDLSWAAVVTRWSARTTRDLNVLGLIPATSKHCLGKLLSKECSV